MNAKQKSLFFSPVGHQKLKFAVIAAFFSAHRLRGTPGTWRGAQDPKYAWRRIRNGTVAEQQILEQAAFQAWPVEDPPMP